MKKIELLCFGELKFKELQGLENHYLKRISYFADFRKTLFKDVKIKDEKQKKEAEAKLVRGHIKGGDFLVALDERGRTYSSQGFSDWLDERFSFQSGKMIFLIGGHAGIAESLKPVIREQISFSKMTFPHDLFRVVFLEQLYRAFTIKKGIQYHR